MSAAPVSPVRPALGLLAVAGLWASLAAPAQAISVSQKDVAGPKAASLAEVEKAAGHKVKVGQTVVLKTTKGVVEIALFPKEAPKTVENFVKLVKKGFYDGTSFHRVIPSFVSQGGDPLSKSLPAGHPQIGTGGPGWNIPDEHGNGLKHIPGAVAMAHSAAPNSAGSQFYITHGEIAHLNGGYTIFGHVTKGFAAAVGFQPSDAGGTPDKIIKATVR